MGLIVIKRGPDKNEVHTVSPWELSMAMANFKDSDGPPHEFNMNVLGKKWKPDVVVDDAELETIRKASSCIKGTPGYHEFAADCIHVIDASKYDMSTVSELKNKYEQKQKLNSAVKRFKKAIKNHPDEKAIREVVLAALNEGVDAIALYTLGVTMCKCHSGQVEVPYDAELNEKPSKCSVTVKWGWFDDTK